MKFELFCLWFMVAMIPFLAGIACWSRMEIQKYVSRPIKLDTEENRQAIQRLVSMFILLCKAIQEQETRDGGLSN